MMAPPDFLASLGWSEWNWRGGGEGRLVLVHSGFAF